MKIVHCFSFQALNSHSRSHLVLSGLFGQLCIIRSAIISSNLHIGFVWVVWVFHFHIQNLGFEFGWDFMLSMHSWVICWVDCDYLRVKSCLLRNFCMFSHDNAWLDYGLHMKCLIKCQNEVSMNILSPIDWV
jgi:hypothetical protein